MTEPSDIYDVDRKTGALILGVNRLEDWATKFLMQYCKEALKKPMPLPVEKLIADAGLTIKTASLFRESIIRKKMNTLHISILPEHFFSILLLNGHMVKDSNVILSFTK